MMIRWLWSLLVVLVVLTLAGCCFVCPVEEEASQRLVNRISAGPAQRQTYEVSLEGADHVRVDVQFGGGTLEVLPGSSALLDAEFVYNLDGLEPQVEYDVLDGRGELVVRQDLDRAVWQPSAEIRNEWQLRFTDQVPLEMAFAVGASRGTMELGGLRLTDLRLESGAADLTVRFSAANPEPMQSLVVRSGAARLDLLELGNAGAESMRFDGGLGMYTFDFQGVWERSMTAHILAGASQVVLRVPRDIGVQVCPGDLRRGDYGGLSQRGICYINEQYDEADIRLDTELDLGLGELRIEQVDRK
jgi:hypothetical protein